MAIRPIIASLSRHRIAALLIVFEIALAFAIVSNAVFLIRERLQRMDIVSGVADHQLVQVQMAYIGNEPDAEARAQVDIAALRQIPGVRDVALINQLPFADRSSNGGIKLGPRQRWNTVHVAEYFGQNIISTLGLRLIAGRKFSPGEYLGFGAVVRALHSDNQKELPHIVIVTEALAERLWPGQPALGKTFYMGNGIQFRVIGVITNLLRPEVPSIGADYSILLPIRISLQQAAGYIIRCAPQDRERVLKAAVATLKRIDPNRVLLKHRTFEQIRHAYFQNDRAMAGILVGVIAALLLTTAFGIAGLASFWVQQRTRQIGVRRALGARRVDILRYFQTENFLLATAGIALGCAAAIGINVWLMAHYAVPRLPIIYLPIGAVTLWLLGQLAVLGPALRAARVAPTTAMRAA
ncbi:FtsX-like permease family protein [Metallibacterium sp.]|uniref:ABC transporter permease n=1 Tax=Metallibacterium sp. TaxID=2940281 RepID=UPI00260AED42|nr:FtsX-like permease family protein [Metallibacterium sp.]